ncbi:MAG TPA: aldose 1-epimerase family protein [Microvirga sp.]|nr:aldose 1-epimerase family protein [Microvirga sp.]
MSGTIVLEQGPARAVIARRGAEPLSWTVGPRSLLWSADPAWWSRTSPILFPVVGWTRGGRILVDGTAYAMGVHGFAADAAFAVEERGEDRVTLVLDDDAESRARFPFRFRLAVEYRLTATALSARLSVANPGRGALPYAVGLHPGFRWPFDGGEPESYEIVFAEPETPEVPVITAGGLFSSRRRPVPLIGRRLPLSAALFAREALCFLDLRSRSLRFVAPSGAALEATFPDFPHVALWSRPGAPFLSIEVWTGHGDPEDFAGDVTEKPSMRLLPPGSQAEHHAAFRLLDPAAA